MYINKILYIELFFLITTMQKVTISKTKNNFFIKSGKVNSHVKNGIEYLPSNFLIIRKL